MAISYNQQMFLLYLQGLNLQNSQMSS